MRKFEEFAIRFCDCCLAVAALLVLLPVNVIIVLAIAIHDGGPPIFSQARVGRDLRGFTIYKFRTMQVASKAPPIGGAQGQVPLHRTQKGDSRITPMGAFLRPSHLDELPQLLNVLRGDMSFVGVRPDTPAQQGDYSPEYWQIRHRYRPGITGPAQIASGDLTLEERSRLEMIWLEQRSFALYMKVMWRTSGKVWARSSN